MLLHAASVALLEKGETGSGADLAGLLVDLWKARGVQCQTEQRGEFKWATEITGAIEGLLRCRAARASRGKPPALVTGLLPLPSSCAALGRRLQSSGRRSSSFVPCCCSAIGRGRPHFALSRRVRNADPAPSLIPTIAKIIQLIALTGSSGSWRKTLTDAAFS